MGYSGRYHVASLAAVFVALAVGILIGAAFGSDVLDDVGRDLEGSLENDLDEANAEIGRLEDDVARQRRFAESIYPALVTGTLAEQQVALVAFGGRPEAVRESVQTALAPTGAEVSQVAVVREPPDLAGLADLGGGQRPQNAERERQRVEAQTRRAGESLVDGGADYDEARETLLASFSGTVGPVDGVIVVRARPELDKPEEAATKALETSFIEGMVDGGVPVVGVEEAGKDPASIEFFDSLGLTTVDNVDQVPGRIALVYALDGAQGNFGTGDEADELIPSVLSGPAAPSEP